LAGLHQLEVFTDASSIALAYYFPSLNFAYYAPLPSNPPSNTIFWFEALAVCSAIHHAANIWACDFSPKLDRLLVRTDSMNSVHMFNSLHAKPAYNSIVDAVSRENFSLARRLSPNLIILSFTPPRDALGAFSQ
jgi:hypothetical protein